MIKLIIENSLIKEQDYRGQHSAPSIDDSPLWDVTLNGGYPEDIYSSEGERMYANSDSDIRCLNIIKSVYKKPKAKVKIYRAVPNLNDKNLKKEIESVKHCIYQYYNGNFMNRGKLPYSERETVHKFEQKYEKDFEAKKISYDEMQAAIAQDMVDYLPTLLDKLKPNIKINSGDWVTLDKQYAIEHGRDNLNNNYKIATKTVSAAQVFTDCNDLSEYGYHE